MCTRVIPYNMFFSLSFVRTYLLEFSFGGCRTSYEADLAGR